jgi:hypothetical protein
VGEASRQDIGGHITAATFRLMWHGKSAHAAGGCPVIGAVIYAVGSVLLARPYVSRPATLSIAVPVAAVAGMAVSELSPWSLPSCSVPSAISLLPAFTQVAAAAAVRGQGDGDSDPAPPGSAGTCLLTETATRTSHPERARRLQDVDGSRR